MSALLTLIQRTFAPLDARINPPSSANRMSQEQLATQAAEQEIWAIGTPPLACIFLTKRCDTLYISKLSVDQSARGKGYARHLIAWAEHRATALSLPALTLDTRVELIENHILFQRLGFTELSRGTHPGFDRPTFVTFRKPV